MYPSKAGSFQNNCVSPFQRQVSLYQIKWNRWSGRIEARTGLRMMPTFPRSPLSFRTAGFPRYGWKAGFSDGARLPRELKSAPDIRGVFASLHPSFVHLVIQRLSRTEPGRGFDRAPP